MADDEADYASFGWQRTVRDLRARVAELEAAQSDCVREFAALTRETGLLRHRAADLKQQADGLMAQMEVEMRRQAARADDYLSRLKATNDDYVALLTKLAARVDHLTAELVDAWHEGHRTSEPLSVVLGLTGEEYAAWVEELAELTVFDFAPAVEPESEAW